MDFNCCFVLFTNIIIKCQGVKKSSLSESAEFDFECFKSTSPPENSQDFGQSTNNVPLQGTNRKGII